MGFLSGRVTYTRYRVGGESPLPFGDETIEQLNAHLIGQHGAGEPQDGVSFGWAGGDHVLDTTLGLEKNVLGDCLHLGLRIDTDKIPGDLLRAYTRIETDARAAGNPSGFPTKAQRTEAKEAALIRAEAEAADGRFRRRKFIPVLWDGQANILYAGSTTPSVLDRVMSLFRDTFDRNLEAITAGNLAYFQAETRGEGRSVEDLGPAPFLSDGHSRTVAWTDADASSRDFWGNEFLLWLWHRLQQDGDTIPLTDGTDVTVMMAKTLTLDCPRGETGRDNLTNEGPTRMPEAFRALQAGKLPRKSGMILVRHGIQYELTIQAETLAVAGLALPKVEGAQGREAHIARIESLRHLVETLDLLYDAYGRRRIGPDWTGDLGRIRHWLTAA